MTTPRDQMGPASLAILNILERRSAHGLKPIPYTVPYSKRNAHHLAPILALATILAGLEHPLTDDELTALTVKLLVYVGRSSHDIAQTCQHIDTDALCRIINHRAGILTSRAGLKAMLRSDSEELRAAARQRDRDEIKPRRLIADFHPYSLTEMTDPHHVREDAMKVGHCAASQYDNAYIKSLGYQPTGREALHTLTYWRRITHGHMRIFSLHHLDNPIATIGYSTHRARITELAIVEKILKPDSRLLPPLCHAIFALRGFLPIRSVAGLPKPPREDLGLDYTGQFVPLSAEGISRIIHAAVFIGSKTRAEELRQYALNAYITLDLTHAPPRILRTLSYARATLRSFSDIKLTELTESGGDILMLSGTSLHTPTLKTVVGSQFLYALRNVYQPALEIVVHDNQCNSVVRLYQPRLQRVGYANVVHNARTVVQPPDIKKNDFGYDIPCVIPRYEE